MRQLKIDPEFRDMIPPTSAEEYLQLEKNVLEDGEVREPIVAWGDTIVDGHNRWKIILAHPEIPFKVKQMNFADKWDAKAWAYRNQLGRRNLSDEQRTYLIGKQLEAEKLSRGGDRRSGGSRESNHQIEGLKSRGTAGRMKNWTTLAAFMLILLFAGAADGIMEALGLVWFAVAGAAVMGAAWALVEVNSE